MEDQADARLRPRGRRTVIARTTPTIENAIRRLRVGHAPRTSMGIGTRTPGRAAPTGTARTPRTLRTCRSLPERAAVLFSDCRAGKNAADPDEASGACFRSSTHTGSRRIALSQLLPLTARETLCAHARQALSLELDDELSVDARDQLTIHLARCDNCRAFGTEVRALTTLLRADLMLPSAADPRRPADPSARPRSRWVAKPAG